MNHRPNSRMFALRKEPPRRLEIAGAEFELVRVFKHDFFAATCLYRCVGPAGAAPGGIERAVVKFPREQSFMGIGSDWSARLMRDHEQAIYKVLEGVQGVPRWMGRVGSYGYAIEYIDARPLDHKPPPPEGFFDRLRELFDAIHARGVGYCDSNKRSNILVAGDGKCYLVDYQISIRRRDDLPWPLRAIIAAAVKYVQKTDMYHLYKHKRRIAPQELTEPEREISRHMGVLIAIHTILTDPWRNIRRRILSAMHREGKLVSPTASLEDHHQPEKETWRK